MWKETPVGGNEESVLAEIKQISSRQALKPVELWGTQLKEALGTVSEERQKEMEKHFQKGVQEGQRWAVAAGAETLQHAAERGTLNEEIRSAGLNPDRNQIYFASPLIEDEYVEISDYFWTIFESEKDYWFDEEAAEAPSCIGREILQFPNSNFRCFEDGWMKSVRDHRNTLTKGGPDQK